MKPLIYAKARSWLAAALVALPFLAAAPPALADWIRAESDRFIVYSEGSERSLREYVQDLETFDRALRSQMGLPVDEAPARKLPIYLVGNRAGLLKVRPTLGENVAGFYVPTSENILAVATRGSDNDIVLHEYAHHFMMQNFSFPYPSWFVEGFAEYYMTANIRDETVELGDFSMDRAYWLGTSEWLPLTDLLTKSPSEMRRDSHQETYYPVAWLLTHWFMGSAERRAQLNVYLRDVGEGGDPVEAMTRATGLTIPELRTALRSYMQGRIPTTTLRGDFPTATIAITRLPASANDLLLLSQRLNIGVPEDQRAATAEEVRRAAARHPGDPLAQLTLGHAELHFGDRARGDEILTALVAADPANIEALQLLASARIRQATDEPEQMDALMAAARRHLAQAYRLDDSNYRTLFLLAQARQAAANYPTENDVNTWLLGHQLAPQLGALRMGAASVLLRVDRRDEAIALLRPLANDPHGRGGAAAEMLASALAGESMGNVILVEDESDGGGDLDRPADPPPPTAPPEPVEPPTTPY